MRFDLSDDEWALLQLLMPKSRMSARADDRKIMNAIFYVLRTGMPWRDLPERYGPYLTHYVIPQAPFCSAKAKTINSLSAVRSHSVIRLLPPRSA
jgi:transposase